MGINFDELKDKAQDALKQHGPKIEQGLDKAAGFAKSKVSGHDEKIDGVAEKAKGFLGKFDDKPDTPPAG
jgi:ABC-type transporter Mla subunit MlaD